MTPKFVLVLILSVLLLSACCTPPPPPPFAPSGSTLNIDRALLEDCRGAVALKSGAEVDVVNWGSEMKEILNECATNKKALVNAIKSVK